jgi:UDP-N-acetylglucosamine--N-acetylmuramyl-(pentapeptide) pyrophosphoryl-undecaprenol N-acetylglucosamine transferase
LTGGGTGGHIFPALEVGRLAAESGDEVRYFGSHRGQERRAAAAAGFPFSATEAIPIPKLASVQGLKAVITLLRSSRHVVGEFRQWMPDVLFATGGYSSGPALRAARALDLPIVLHEQNSIPGRGTKSMAAAAAKICIVFVETYKHFPSEKTVLTGMPVRQQLVDAARSDCPGLPFTTLVTGGSQGARALNEAAIRSADGQSCWIHITGPDLFGEMRDLSKSSNYKVVPFLEANEMADVLGKTSLAIVRAGCGTIAELAIFGVPAIYVPLPTSFAGHQLHNAREIERIGGGSVVEQRDLSPRRLAEEWRAWRDDEPRRARASAALKAWAKPDAAAQVLAVVKGAAA